MCGSSETGCRNKSFFSCCAYANETKCAKFTPRVSSYGQQFAARENHEYTGIDQQYRLFTVRRLGGETVTLLCRGSLLVSDIVSGLATGLEVLVYHGGRLLLNDERICASELAAGCCLEVRERIGGGGGGSSKIRPVDGKSMVRNAEVSD